MNLSGSLVLSVVRTCAYVCVRSNHLLSMYLCIVSLYFLTLNVRVIFSALLP